MTSSVDDLNFESLTISGLSRFEKAFLKNYPILKQLYDELGGCNIRFDCKTNEVLPKEFRSWYERMKYFYTNEVYGFYSPLTSEMKEMLSEIGFSPSNLTTRHLPVYKLMKLVKESKKSGKDFRTLEEYNEILDEIKKFKPEIGGEKLAQFQALDIPIEDMVRDEKDDAEILEIKRMRPDDVGSEILVQSQVLGISIKDVKEGAIENDKMKPDELVSGDFI